MPYPETNKETLPQSSLAMYSVWNGGNFLFAASLDVTARVLRLQQPAIDRILREIATKGEGELFSSRQDWPFAVPKLTIRYQAEQWQLLGE